MSGTWMPTCFAALTIPEAMTSHFMMPPKMFTRSALTFLSAVRILNASTTCCSDAFPPTSRKFAGDAPCREMMSMVAIARPAPFTMHPMFPSRPM